MFNEADLLPLPGLPPTYGQESPPEMQIETPNGNSCLSKDAAISNTAAKAAASAAATGRTARAAVSSDTGVPPWLPDKASYCHVVEACAMMGEDVALAMSDGRLCYANISTLSTVLKAGARDDEDKRLDAWPDWSSWNSRHGNILELHHSPAHDALMTLEHATTAAGDQLFLGRYHKPKGPKGDGLWESCTIPLATSDACMAVCPRRGWAAVCTGAVINLWAVSRPDLDPSNTRTSRPRQPSTGFEHALALDLAELVGTGEGSVHGGTNEVGGAKHVALFGNMLAVGTDYAIFLLHLSFDVKGETPLSYKTASTHADSHSACPSQGEDAPTPPSPSTPSPPKRPTQQRGKIKVGVRTPTTLTPKSHSRDSSKELPPKVALRSGNHKGKQDDSGARNGKGSSMGGKDGRVGSGRVSSSAGGGSGRDGVVEGSVLEAEDMVVCVLQGGGGGDDGSGLGGKGSAPPPALLRSFDDDWETFGTRGAHPDETWWELETDPAVMDMSSESVPAMGNPAVMDRVGDSEVILARRVGPGEVVKGLSLLPVSCGDDECLDGSHISSPSPSPSSSIAPSLSCRLVLLTNKAATVCLVCTNPISSPTSSSMSSLPRIPSPSSSSSSLTSSSSYPSRLEGRDRRISEARGSHVQIDIDPMETRCSGGNTRGSSPVRGLGGETEIDLGDWPLRVFLRRSCRFNHDLLRASIMRCFLFALTVDGLEVWTFPSDNISAAEHLEGPWLEEAGGMSTGPSPRPCLLHVQRLEMEGMMPRSPARSFVAIGGARPGVVIFPAPDKNQTLSERSSLAFLSWQSAQRLRADGAVDERTLDENVAVFPPSPPSSQHTFTSAIGSDASSVQWQDTWQSKWTAWRKGVCGVGGGNAGTSSAPPLALVLRLRTPTEAFRLLSAAEERAPCPRLKTVSAAFLAAAEGLHGALMAEVAACWRAAVCSGSRDRTQTASTNCKTEKNKRDAATGVGIETIIPKLAQCWKLQRVAARCALFMAQLCLEEAIRVAATTAGGDGIDSISVTAQAYGRACSWLLESDQSLVESFTRLGEAATRILDAVVPFTRPLGDSHWTEVTVEALDRLQESGDEGDDARSPLSLPGSSSLGLEEALSRAMHEHYLLRALGVGANSGIRSATLGSRSPLGPLNPLAPGKVDSPPLENMLTGLVNYLHLRDMKRALQSPVMRDIGVGEPRSMSLAVAVVCASRTPWIACPNALSRAMRALDDQERALTDNSPSLSSSTSDRSSQSRSSSGGLGAARRPASDSRCTNMGGASSVRSMNSKASRREGRRAELIIGGVGDEREREREGEGGNDRIAYSFAWIAVARAVLNGYWEAADSTAASARESCRPMLAPGHLDIGGAEDAILQLACERHPVLVAARSGSTGPLAKIMLAAGRSRPLVRALVRLTSCYTAGGRPFGSHRVGELLQLTGKCFSPTMDPLQALRVLGAPGRQMASRLESLKRASLDAVEGEGSPPIASRQGSFEPLELQGSPFGSVVLDRVEKGEIEAQETAAREFLSRRCAVSLAQANRGTREEERLSEALGAPAAWQASLAQNRALDRAILRHLIAAHLDDLRTLEGPSAVRPQAARQIPVGAGFVGSASAVHARNSRPRGGTTCWTDLVVPLLTGCASQRDIGAAEGHLAAIMALVREVTWRGNGGNGSGMSPEEASEVVTEAKRRLPAPTPASPGGLQNKTTKPTGETMAWGAGGVGVGMQRATWPWPSRGVPLSAVGAIVALAAALPPSGKLLAGVDVILQVSTEVVGAAKAEAAVAAGVAATAALAERGATGARRPPAIAVGGSYTLAEAGAVVNEVSEAAERALLLYVVEYCGRDPQLWASVTSHVKYALLDAGQGSAGGRETLSMDAGAAHRLVSALLRRCGEELGGADLVRALPEGLTLMECLDEVERSLCVEEGMVGALGLSRMS